MQRLAILLAWLAMPVFARAAETGQSNMTMTALAHARSRIAEIATDFSGTSADSAYLWQAITPLLANGEGVRALAYLLILLIIGVGAEWLYWTYAYAPLQVVGVIHVASPRHAFQLGMRRFAIVGAGLLLFAMATLTGSVAFDWPPGVQEVLIAGIFSIILLRLVWLALQVILAPHRSDLRLVSLAEDKVVPVAALVMVLTLIFVAGRFVPDALEGSAPHLAHVVQLVSGTVAAIVMLAAALLAYRQKSRPLQNRARRLPQVPRSLRVITLIFTVYAVWLLAGASSAQVVAILGIIIALQGALHGLVFHFWRDQTTPLASSQLVARDDGLDPKLIPSVILAGIRLVVVLAGLAACALALGVPVMALAMSEHPLVRFAVRVLGVAALALLTNVVWLILKSAIDHRLALIGPHEPHGAPGPNARLRTLLPLTRIAAAVFLVSMFVLSALWALGIEITPLLAGAGVIGLALGFGAQALVRDIIAGIFLLVEDVFRVGEYIESGSSTKGTVERITLRTVALRHHNGPLHFVPFGSLGVVRNNSRDWVIEKFNLPLPVTADSERVRKMLKKIGQEMMEDAELAPLIHMPLKGKLYRVDPGLKIFRCSFQTAPGNQFDVRAAAYRRIELAMKEMGIGFADGRQMMVVQEGARI